MSKIKAGRDISPFGVRIPTALKDKLQEESDKSGRSLNAEIIYRLEKSFESNAGAEAVISNQDLKNLIEKLQLELIENLTKAMEERDQIYQEFVEKRHNKKGT